MLHLSRAFKTLLLSSKSASKPSTRALSRRPPTLAGFSTRHDGPTQHDLPTSELSNDDARFSSHLNSVFPSLAFPPELARRILTHGSHRAAAQGHNGRLGFIGRRVLESYFLLFIHEATHSRAHHDYDRLSSRALNTYLLGEHVAPRWFLGRVLLWVPTLPRETLRAAQNQHPDSELDEALAGSPSIAKSVGLYKVMGEAVQAIVGGVYHQFGGSIAHQLFHTRILPHILLPGRSTGVPEELHAAALQICERMGGTESSLLCHPNIHERPQDKHAHMVTKKAVAAGM